MNNYSVIPQVIIEIDCSALANEIIQTIQLIRIKQVLSAPSQGEIILPEAHERFSTKALAKIGSLISIKIGDQNQSLFYGQITAIEYVYDASIRPLISIRCYDLLHQLRKRQPVRTHIHVNLYQLAQELTQDLGLTIVGGEKTPIAPRLIQYKQSDLQFLYKLGEGYGQYLFLNKKHLLITSLEGTKTNEHLTLGENFYEARFSINAETVTESVTATGWNLQRVTPHSRTVETSNVETSIHGLIDPADFGTNGQRMLVDYDVDDENQAETAAQKELDRYIKQQVSLWGVTDGNPDLTPGSAVHVSGVEASLEGQYVLTEVNHTIDPEKGFISEINTAPPGITRKKAFKNATIGVVSQVDDPDKLGRIKVSLPTYNNIETDWLEVLTPGAGSQKGQLILPDVGDNVLLLIINGEPAQSVVLGGLYGEKDLPQSVVEDGSVKRYITQTAGKQRILLDDAEVSIRIETKNGHSISMTPEKIGITRNNGSFVTLTDDRMTIHSETDLEIEAPGSSITFRGKKIDFEEA